MERTSTTAQEHEGTEMVDSWEAKIAGTFINADTKIAKSLCGAADVGTSDGKVTPRNNLSDADFATSGWWATTPTRTEIKMAASSPST